MPTTIMGSRTAQGQWREKIVDRITKSHLETFRLEQSLGEIDESVLFEYFADYCVVTDAYDEEFDVADVHVGGSDDLGLDGLAINVNGALVTSTDEAEDLLALNGYLDVVFNFVQAKTTSGFSGEQIVAFFDGVDAFFEESPTLPMTDKLTNLHGIMAWIYEKSIKFRRQKPSVHLSFVTTGQWKHDQYLQSKIDKRVEQLRGTGLFSEVVFEALGADELHASYQRSRNSVVTEFTFANKVLLADMEGVSESYLGVLPVSEFLTLITDHAGSIRKSLFYDNIRDFQDYNPVNGEIRSTLHDAAAQGRFAVLNNGVTVVARGLQTTGNKFVLTDYQIVNGCQTSHVLFDERESLNDGVQVPLKSSPPRTRTSQTRSSPPPTGRRRSRPKISTRSAPFRRSSKRSSTPSPTRRSCTTNGAQSSTAQCPGSRKSASSASRSKYGHSPQCSWTTLTGLVDTTRTYELRSDQRSLSISISWSPTTHRPTRTTSSSTCSATVCCPSTTSRLATIS